MVSNRGVFSTGSKMSRYPSVHLSGGLIDVGGVAAIDGALIHIDTAVAWGLLVFGGNQSTVQTEEC